MYHWVPLFEPDAQMSQLSVVSKGPQKRGAVAREAILDAGLDMFLQDGFDHVSMDEIALRAGVTKRTVYAHGQSKQSLFEEVIGQHIIYYMRGLPNISPNDDVNHAVSGYLFAIGGRFSSPDFIKLEKLILFEAMRFPAFLSHLAAGFRSAESQLYGYIEQAVRTNQLPLCDPRRTTQTLFGAAVYARSFLGMLRQTLPSHDEISELVDDVLLKQRGSAI